MKNRRLIGNDRERFIATLSEKPKGVITIGWPAGNAEAETFAHDIINALITAGWPEPHKNMVVGAGAARFGLLLDVHNVHNAPLSAKSLQDAFEAIGFHALGEETMADEKAVGLFIGSRP